jgi:hypothetical protein
MALKLTVNLHHLGALSSCNYFEDDDLVDG